ncbi:hypothetical protein U1Q18_023490 [Sarracenia purpurea var. burkii]
MAPLDGATPPPQTLVPMWAIPSNAAPTFWILPPTPAAAAIAGPSNQPQILATFPTAATPFINLSGRPVSSFVASLQPPISITSSPPPPPRLGHQSFSSSGTTSSTVGANTKKAVSTIAPSSSSSTGKTSIKTATQAPTQMLRDFSLEIFEKQELHQFMAARSFTPHAQSSKP